MPALDHQRHERLAHERALGKTAVAAWEIVCGKRSAAYASAVGKRPDVKARIAELKAAQQALHKKVEFPGCGPPEPRDDPLGAPRAQPSHRAQPEAAPSLRRCRCSPP